MLEGQLKMLDTKMFQGLFLVINVRVKIFCVMIHSKINVFVIIRFERLNR